MADPLGFIGDVMLGPEDGEGPSLNPFEALGRGVQGAVAMGRIGEVSELGGALLGRDPLTGTDMDPWERYLGAAGAALGVAALTPHVAPHLFPRMRRGWVQSRVAAARADAPTVHRSPWDPPPDVDLEDYTPSILRTAVNRVDRGGGPVGGESGLISPRPPQVEGVPAVQLSAEAQVFTSGDATNRLLTGPDTRFEAVSHITSTLLSKADDAAIEQSIGILDGLEDAYANQLISHHSEIMRLQDPQLVEVYRARALAYEVARFNSFVDRKLSGANMFRSAKPAHASRLRKIWGAYKNGEQLSAKDIGFLHEHMVKFAKASEGIDHPELRLNSPTVHVSQYDMDTGQLWIDQADWDAKPLADLSAKEVWMRVAGLSKMHPAQLTEVFAENMLEMWDDWVKPEAVDAYRLWYQTEGLRIVERAKDTPYTARKLTQIAAILSPGEDWGTNIDKAVEMADVVSNSTERDYLRLHRELRARKRTVSRADLVKAILAVEHDDPDTMWTSGINDAAEAARMADVIEEQVGWDKITKWLKDANGDAYGIEPISWRNGARQRFLDGQGFTLHEVGVLWDNQVSGADLIHWRRTTPPDMSQKTNAFDKGLSFSSDLDLDIQREALDHMMAGVLSMEEARDAVPVVVDRQSIKTAMGFSLNPSEGAALDNALYDQAAQAHRLVAEIISKKHGIEGLLPQEVQAILWSVWRHISGGDPSPMYPNLNRFDPDLVQPGMRWPRTAGQKPAGWVAGKGPQAVTNDRLLRALVGSPLNSGYPINSNLIALPDEIRATPWEKYGHRTKKRPKHSRQAIAISPNADGSMSAYGRPGETMDPTVLRGVFPTGFFTDDGRQVMMPRRADMVASVDDYLKDLKDTSRWLKDPVLAGAVGGRIYHHVPRQFAKEPGWWMRIGPPKGKGRKTAGQMKQFEKAMTDAGIQFTAHGVESKPHDGMSYAFHRVDEPDKLHWSPPKGESVTDADMRNPNGDWRTVQHKETMVDYWYEFPTAEDQRKVQLLLEQDESVWNARRRKIETARMNGELLPALPEDFTYYPQAGKSMAEAQARISRIDFDAGYDAAAFEARVDELFDEIQQAGIEVVKDRRRTSSPYKTPEDLVTDINENRRIVVPARAGVDWKTQAVYDFHGRAGTTGIRGVWGSPEPVGFAHLARHFDDNGLVALEDRLGIVAPIKTVEGSDARRMVDRLFGGEDIVDRQYFGAGMTDAPPGTYAVYEHHFMDPDGNYMTVMSLSGDANDPNTIVTYLPDPGGRFEFKNYLDADRSRLFDTGTGGHQIRHTKGRGAMKEAQWDRRTMLKASQSDWQIADNQSTVDRVFDVQIEKISDGKKGEVDHIWIMWSQDSPTPQLAAPEIHLMASKGAKPPPTPEGTIAIKATKTIVFVPEAMPEEAFPLIDYEMKRLGLVDMKRKTLR